MNDTVGPDGLVPSLLVFGAVPSYPITNKDFPGQESRMKAIIDVRSEYGKIVSELRIQKPIRSKLPPDTKFDLRAGDKVLVYREKRGWTGPFTLQSICGKNCYVSDGSKTVKFNVVQLLPYSADKRNHDLKRLLTGIREFQSIPDIHMTNVFYTSDKKAKTVECQTAVAKEISGLIRRKVFEIVKKKEIRPNSNIM